MATKKERATQIRTATIPGENTADRVGSLLEDIVDHQDRVDASLETLRGDIDEVGQKTTELELESEAIRKLSEQADEKADITSKVVSPIDEAEFVVADSNGNVAIKYNGNGLDTAKISPHMMSILNEVKPVVYIEVVEDGFFVVDNSLNIGLCIDGNGTHSNNLVEI